MFRDVSGVVVDEALNEARHSPRGDGDKRAWVRRLLLSHTFNPSQTVALGH